jgi:hypothetical protein
VSRSGNGELRIVRKDSGGFAAVPAHERPRRPLGANLALGFGAVALAITVACYVVGVVPVPALALVAFCSGFNLAVWLIGYPRP